MAKTKSKKAKPPKFEYPTSPHVIGLNWLEMPVADPQKAADRYVSVGAIDRGKMNDTLRVLIGGILVHLVQGDAQKSSRGKDGRPPVRFELTVDQVEMKHKQLEMLDLKPGKLEILENGARGFEWQDEDGYVFRFVGPARRPDDPITL